MNRIIVTNNKRRMIYSAISAILLYFIFYSIINLALNVQGAELPGKVVTLEEITIKMDDLETEEFIVVESEPVTTVFEESVSIEYATEPANVEVVTMSNEPVVPEVSEEEKIRAIDYCMESFYMYVDVSLDSSLNLRTEATTERDNVVASLKYADRVKVVGMNSYDSNWYVIEHRGQELFVYSTYLSEWVDFSLRVDEEHPNPNWDGETVLNSVNGKIQGPSGVETYYNLKIDRCIYYCNLLGYRYDVWVREDGVKMFGDYVMVAANLDIRPKGSLVMTSLGMGIVVDTGEFVNWEPYGLDIAVTW